LGIQPPLAMTPATLLAVAPTAAVATATSALQHREWTSRWLESGGDRPRSALAYEEKRAMKEQILQRILDDKAALDLASMRVPGGIL